MTAGERERRPRGSAWEEIPTPPEVADDGNTIAASTWLHRRRRLRVISSLVLAAMPDGAGDSGPQWHLSFAVIGHARRPNREDLALVRIAFGFHDGEEDNHEPGVARHLWLPVDPARRVDCECKADETLQIEADGHRWSAPADKAERIRGALAKIHAASR